MLGVGDCIPDDILEEDLQNPAGLLINEARDSLDASTTSQTPDGWLGDALDVIPEDLPVPLSTSLACTVIRTYEQARFCGKSHYNFSIIVGFSTMA